MATTNDIKNMSEDQLISEAQLGLRGQGAIVEMKRRIGEQSTKAARNAIVVAIVSLAVSLVALYRTW